MKNFSKLLLMIIIVFGCQNENQLDVYDNHHEQLSDIESIEMEYGITFSKQDLQLFDESGKNYVTIRFAHQDKSVLDEYLALVTYKITPIYEINQSKDFTIDKPLNTDQTPLENDVNLNGIFTEFINLNLEKGVIGIKTDVIPNDGQIASSRVQANGYLYQQTHTSMNWPDLCNVWTNNTVRYKFTGQTAWWSGWSTRTFCNYDEPSICYTDWIQPAVTEYRTNVDGPYKVRLVIDFDCYCHYSWTFIKF